MVRTKQPANFVHPGYPPVRANNSANRTYVHFREFAHAKCEGPDWVGNDVLVSELLQDFANSYYRDRNGCSIKSLKTYCNWVVRALRDYEQVSPDFQFTWDMSAVTENARQPKSKSKSKSKSPKGPVAAKPPRAKRVIPPPSPQVTFTKPKPNKPKGKTKPKTGRPVGRPRRSPARKPPPSDYNGYDNIWDDSSAPTPESPLAITYGVPPPKMPKISRVKERALVKTGQTRVQVGEKAYYRHADLFMEVTRALAATTGTSSFECRNLAFELYRGLVCRAVYAAEGGDESQLSFPSRIEKAWQCAVLNTNLYMIFCADVFGEFVHYTTAGIGLLDAEERADSIERTRAQYSRTWGEDPPDPLWTPFMDQRTTMNGPATATHPETHPDNSAETYRRAAKSILDRQEAQKRARDTAALDSEDEPLNGTVEVGAQVKRHRSNTEEPLTSQVMQQSNPQPSNVGIVHASAAVPNTHSGVALDRPLSPEIVPREMEGGVKGIHTEEYTMGKSDHDQSKPSQSADEQRPVVNGTEATSKPPKLEFRVSNEKNEFVRFNVSPNTRLLKVMTAYCKLNELVLDTVVFVMRSESGAETQISENDTVSGLDLEGKILYMRTRQQ